MEKPYILRNATGKKEEAVLYRYASSKYADASQQAIYDSVYRGVKPATFDAANVAHKEAFEAAKTQRATDIAAGTYDYLALAKQPKKWESWLMKVGLINRKKWYSRQFQNAGGIGDITVSQLLLIAVIAGAIWKHKEIIAFFKGN